MVCPAHVRCTAVSEAYARHERSISSRQLAFRFQHEHELLHERLASFWQIKRGLQMSRQTSAYYIQQGRDNVTNLRGPQSSPQLHGIPDA